MCIRDSPGHLHHYLFDGGSCHGCLLVLGEEGRPVCAGRPSSLLQFSVVLTPRVSLRGLGAAGRVLCRRTRAEGALTRCQDALRWLRGVWSRCCLGSLLAGVGDRARLAERRAGCLLGGRSGLGRGELLLESLDLGLRVLLRRSSRSGSRGLRLGRSRGGAEGVLRDRSGRGGVRTRGRPCTCLLYTSRCV